MSLFLTVVYILLIVLKYDHRETFILGNVTTPQGNLFYRYNVHYECLGLIASYVLNTTLLDRYCVCC